MNSPRSPTPRRRATPVALALAGAAAAVPVSAAVSPAASEPSLQARIEALRRVWAERRALPAAELEARGWTLAQASNWTNWPKWSKWSNWANK